MMQDDPAPQSYLWIAVAAEHHHEHAPCCQPLLAVLSNTSTRVDRVDAVPVADLTG